MPQVLDPRNLPPGCSHLPEPSARSVFVDLLLGLEYLHSNGILHRDLKPARRSPSSAPRRAVAPSLPRHAVAHPPPKPACRGAPTPGSPLPCAQENMVYATPPPPGWHSWLATPPHRRAKLVDFGVATIKDVSEIEDEGSERGGGGASPQQRPLSRGQSAKGSFRASFDDVTPLPAPDASARAIADRRCGSCGSRASRPPARPPSTRPRCAWGGRTTGRPPTCGRRA